MKPSRIEFLESIVKRRTKKCILDSRNKSTENLLRAHYLLAELYYRQGNERKTKVNINKAIHEFFNFYGYTPFKGTPTAFRNGLPEIDESDERLIKYKAKIWNAINKIDYYNLEKELKYGT